MTSEDFLGRRGRPNDVPTKNFCVHFFQQSTPPNSNCIITNTKIFFPFLNGGVRFSFLLNGLWCSIFIPPTCCQDTHARSTFALTFMEMQLTWKSKGKKQFSDMHKCHSPYRGPQQVIGVQLIRKWNIIFFDKNWTCFLVQKMTLIFFQFQTYFRNSGHELF